MAGIWAKRSPRFYVIYFLGFTLFALFYFSQGLVQKVITRDATPWWHYLTSWLTGMYLTALTAPVIFWLGDRFPFARRNWIRRFLLHGLFGAIYSASQLAVESVILNIFGVFPTIMNGFTATFSFLMVMSFHANIIAYYTLIAGRYGWNYYQKYLQRAQDALRLELHASELKTQLASAHLSALKMQLQPHFLFNTLNAIMVLVRQQKGKEAEEMLARLSDLLRCVLEDVEAQEVPLRRELEYVRLYLSIEEVRFQDRMKVEIAAGPDVLDAAVPHMALQPIVENAIRHGIGRRSAAGRIQIRARRVAETLEVTVTDDGPGLPASEAASGHGIGLANTRARLRQLYGESAQLALENGQAGGAVVTLVVPFQAVTGYGDMGMMEVHAVERTDR